MKDRQLIAINRNRQTLISINRNKHETGRFN